MSHRRFRAFTLIELLVVISIIALLIAILLPTLHRVRRAGLVTQCSARLKSYILGLTVYATEDQNGHYPIGDVGVWGHTHAIWSTEGAYASVSTDWEKMLATYTDVICAGNRWLLWCPVWVAQHSDDTLSNIPRQHPDWPLLWYDDRFGLNFLTMYYRYGNLQGPSSMWLNSGNSQTDGPPLRPGPSNDAILSDAINNNGPGQGTQYFQSPHMEASGVTEERVLEERRENNVAYSDGHAETHGGGYIGNDGYFTWGGAHWVQHGTAPWRLQY